jgi:deaminated glutathione amidase
MQSMRLPVALIQLDATSDVDANIERATALAAEAASGGARLVVLPEYLQYRGDDDGFRASARPIPGPFTEAFGDVARRHDAWILAGSLAETSGDPGCPYNTSVLIAPDGAIAATYRKIHLFDVAVDDGPVDTESARVSAGDQVVVADVDGVLVGLSICYDLRFPELYRTLALAGAEVLAVPSNFTERTGRDHWEVLLRARAIENGAWVVAPGQSGGPPGNPSFGRSMIVDPWGTVVAQAADGVGIVRADVETDRVAAVRRQIPSLANRRPETYRSA